MTITKMDFLNKVDRHPCSGRVVENGKATEGHENCRGCQGNYLHGGECNFGGNHTIDHDLNIINQNFNRFNLLLERQDELVKAVSEKDFNKQKQKLIDDYQYLIRSCEADKLDFFAGTCITIENKQHVFLEQVKQYLRLLAEQIKFFVQEAQEMDWWKLKNYQDKVAKLEKMNKEATQIATEYRAAVERGDEAEASRLLGLLKEKQSAMASLEAEIRKDPVDKLLGEKTRRAFNDIVSSIWKNKTNVFDWIKEKEKKKKNQTQEKKIWGFIPQKYWGKVKWGAIILVSIMIAWLIIRWIYKKIK